MKVLPAHIKVEVSEPSSGRGFYPLITWKGKKKTTIQVVVLNVENGEVELFEEHLLSPQEKKMFARNKEDLWHDNILRVSAGECCLYYLIQQWEDFMTLKPTTREQWESVMEIGRQKMD